MKASFVSKSLVCIVVILFIGVAIARSINFIVVKASNDDDLVEVTAQTCGIKGYDDTTVKLSRQQYQNLEEFLVKFRARLNQTTTREEAVPIFKEAVVELDKYGLLPKGMTIERAQRFITNEDMIQNAPNFIKKSISKGINFLCLFTAITYNVIDLNIWLLFYFMLSQYIPYDSPLILLYYFFFFIGFIKPLCFFNFLSVNYGGEFIFYSSIGLKGIRSGANDVSTVIGFTGLKIWLNLHNAFYLGFALSVQ